MKKTQLKNNVLVSRTRFIIRNLFGSVTNTIISVVVLYVLVQLVSKAVHWGITTATFTGDSKQICFDNGGACWIFIREKFLFFIYGFVPRSEYWRINILFVLIILLMMLFFVKKIKNKSLLFLVYLGVFPLCTYILAYGGFWGLKEIPFDKWGGFMLTALLSLFGLMFSFPLGLLLSLGRRSKLPIVRYFSVGYIEFFRGIPLITILFMASTVALFFLPQGYEVPKVLRIIIGLVFFQSAYLAEIIRGGLQDINKAQYESADSLGLNYFYKMYYVILPQALRTVIINIGDISVAFIKDSTLVYIIGLFDMLGIYVPVTSDSLWLGMEPEALIFSGILYWVLCYIIATFVRIADKRINKDRRGVSL